MPECSCFGCHNYEGSDLRARALAGEDLDLKPATRREREDDEMLDEEDDEVNEVRLRPRRTSRRKIGNEGEDEAKPAAKDASWITPRGIVVMLLVVVCDKYGLQCPKLAQSLVPELFLFACRPDRLVRFGISWCDWTCARSSVRRFFRFAIC